MGCATSKVTILGNSNHILKTSKSGDTYSIYGRTFDVREISPLQLELFAWREKLGENDGFVNPEYHFRQAFALMYPKFKMHKWVDMEIEAYCNYKVINVIGHTRASKTFTFAYIVYLDYCANPFETMISLATVTFSGLRTRMWSDLMSAVEQSRIPSTMFKITSSSADMSITNAPEKGLTREQNLARQKFMIQGLAVSKQKDSAARIQGMHAPRRIVVLDEAQGLPDAIYDAEKNAQSAPYGKFIRLANPEDRYSVFGRECEPKTGWDTVHDTDLAWPTKQKDSICLHLDGFQCHNMELHYKKERGEITKEEYEKNLLPFQPTAEYFLGLDPDSITYWKFGKGYFPPDGLITKVFNDMFLASAAHDNESFVYGGTTIACLDPAFEHDDCVLQIFEYGKKRNGQWHVNCLSSHKIVPKIGGFGGSKPKDYQIAKQVTDICKANGIRPENFIMDKSGNGRGVYAIMQVEWDGSIEGCEFGGKATKRLLREGDDQPCNEKYAYFVDELWFRAAEWMRYGDVTGLNNLDNETKDDLSSRLYNQKSKDNDLLRVESKKDMKSRIGKSPDFGDAFCLFAELLARKGIIPGLKNTDGERIKSSNKSALERARKVNAIYEDSFSSAAF